MDDKEIAKELTIAALGKTTIPSNAHHGQQVADQVAEMFKTLYAAVHDASKEKV